MKRPPGVETGFKIALWVRSDDEDRASLQRILRIP